MTVTLGVVFRPQYPPELLRPVAEAAEETGVEQLWLWEDCFGEAGVSAATAALAWTSHLRVAIGLLPVPLRNVALTAMETATLARLFPGRIEVGVGHGVQDWMGQVGARVESPMTLLREYVTALRALLSGERVSIDGRYIRLDGVALDWPPTPPPRLYVGAIGPRSVALSAELADGTILPGGVSPDGVRKARSRLAAAGPEHVLVAYLMAATGAGAAERLEAEQRAWSLDPANETGVAGDAADIAAAVRRWADAGADIVVLQPTADEPDLVGFVRFAAEQVRPLI